MSIEALIALFALVATCMGGGFMFLNNRINDAEAKSLALVADFWSRAESTFATKVDLARMEGKLDAILLKIEYLAEKRHE